MATFVSDLLSLISLTHTSAIEQTDPITIFRTTRQTEQTGRLASDNEL